MQCTRLVGLRWLAGSTESSPLPYLVAAVTASALRLIGKLNRSRPLSFASE
jgi:hypothetical protein